MPNNYSERRNNKFSGRPCFRQRTERVLIFRLSEWDFKSHHYSIILATSQRQTVSHNRHLIFNLLIGGFYIKRSWKGGNRVVCKQ